MPQQPASDNWTSYLGLAVEMEMCEAVRHQIAPDRARIRVWRKLKKAAERLRLGGKVVVGPPKENRRARRQKASAGYKAKSRRLPHDT